MGRFFHRLAAVQIWTAAIGLIAITGFVIAAVIARYVLSAPLAWAEEASKLLLIAIVYFGSGAISFHGDHLRADVFGETLPPRVTRIREILIEGLMAALFLALTVQAAQFAQRISTVGQVTAALGIYQWLLVAWAAIGLGLMVVAHLYRVVALLRGRPTPPSAFAVDETTGDIEP